MYETCLNKQEAIKKLFNSFMSDDEKYAHVIEMGRALPPYPKELKIPSHEVKGCQSTMYLQSEMRDGKVFFNVESDALISKGLAALLITVYSGESPESILKCPPDYLEQMGITANLTPNRANGLYSIHLRMKQEALRLLLGR